MALPRLRQVALAAHDLDGARAAIEPALGVGDPFHDPGVGEFGLHNAVWNVGDTFLEVVSPKGPDTAAERYLSRRAATCAGYMAIFQVDDMAEARARIAAHGVRVVWQADLGDISGTHLHPRDVPGAIVSVDWAQPEGSWRWGGPRWTGGVPHHHEGGIDSIEIRALDPDAAARTWASVLGLEADGSAVVLDDQSIVFVETAHAADEGIAVARFRHAHVPATELTLDAVTLEVL